jgi:hypothetical protein
LLAERNFFHFQRYSTEPTEIQYRQLAPTPELLQAHLLLTFINIPKIQEKHAGASAQPMFSK